MTSSWPRTALVTGSTNGIGRSVATTLAQAGLFVVVTGRDDEAGRETCAEIRAAGGSAALLLADLTEADAVDDLARRAVSEAGGHIDVLVNNAGEGFYAPTEEIAPATFDALFALNVRAPFQLTGALAPAMATRGHGAIVNITGTAADLGVPGLSVFGAAKAALASMTRTWAAEYGPRGVRVNAVHPGAIVTARNTAAREIFDGYSATIPARRAGSADEIAGVVSFLVSPTASYVHGVVLPVDGGMVVTTPTTVGLDDLSETATTTPG